MIRQYRGFSYLELLMVLSLVGMLSLLAIMNFQPLLVSQQAEEVQWQLMDAIKLGQQLAQSKHQLMALCLANAANECVENGAYLQVFTESGLSPKQVWMKMPLAVSVGHLQWRLFPRTYPYIVFSNNLSFVNSNGTIWYSQNEHIYWALRLSKTGLIKLLPETHVFPSP